MGWLLPFVWNLIFLMTAAFSLYLTFSGNVAVYIKLLRMNFHFYLMKKSLSV